MDNTTNRIEGSKVLAITNGASVPHVEFIEDYKQTESGLRLIYYTWLARFFIFLAILSLSLFVCASLALFRLAPQVVVKPFLIVPEDNSEQIVRAETIELGMPSKDKLLIMFIKQYIEMRNEVIDDRQEMQSRWLRGGIIDFLSSRRVFNEFEKWREPMWYQITQSGLVQEVEIVSLNRVGGKKSSVWKVDFKTYILAQDANDNTSREKLMTIKHWTASVTAAFIPSRVFTSVRLINPLGFTVFRYSQTQVEGL